jgi:N-acetylglucosamine-6-sulfatase
VRGPDIAPGSHVEALTGNIDLAPTIAALGGASLTDSPDGRSLVPFLHGQTPSTWRQAYLLEHWKTTGAPENRSGAGQLEPPDIDQSGISAPSSTTTSTPTTTVAGAAAPPGVGELNNIPAFQGLRTARYTYVEYSTGERELYDLSTDPQELDNLAATANPALLAALHQRLDALRACKAAGCRNAENAPLDLPSS